MSLQNAANVHLFKEIMKTEFDLQTAKMKHDEYLEGRRSMLLGYAPPIETIEEKESLEKLYNPYITIKKKYDGLIGSLSKRELFLYEQFKKDTYKTNESYWLIGGGLILGFVVIILSFIFPTLTTTYVVPLVVSMGIGIICLVVKEYKVSNRKEEEFINRWGVYPGSNTGI